MADDAIPSSASWVQSPDNTPTMEVRPKREEKPAAAGKLTHADMVERWQARGFSKEGAEGIADNMMRESGGDPTIPGDKGTSFGLFQHHAERKAALEQFAKAKGVPASDPEVQIDFADHEMKTQMPKLRETLMAATDRNAAEGSFKRIFERPAAGQWEGGKALLGNGRYKFADTAMAEHQDKPNTDLVYMPTADYLDLSPQLKGEPFANSAGRSLRRSLARGDNVESVPSLDVNIDGPTATVTDQDGRHRALAAQEAGLTHIPVAINRSGEGQPTELVGMQGRVLPHRYPTAADVSHAPQPDGSIWGSLKDALVPSAQAAEMPAQPSGANPFDQFDAPAAQAQPASGGNPFDQFDAPPAPAGSDAPDVAPMSRMQRVGEGLLQGTLAAEQVAGRILPVPKYDAATGKWVSRSAADDAAVAAQQDRLKTAGVGALDPYMLGGQIANPINYMPMGEIGKAVEAGPAAMGAMQGLWSSIMTTPVTGGGNFLAEKGKQGLVGSVAGAGAVKAAELAGKALAPVIDPLVNFVAGVKGPNVVKDAATKEILRRIAQDVKGGGPTAQDMLDLLNAAPGKPLTLADVGGENLLGLAGKVARAPGEARQIMADFLNERDLNAGLRLAEDVNAGLGKGARFNVAKALSDSRAAASRPAYEAAYLHPAINPDVMKPEGEIGALLSRPSMRAGLGNARKIAAEEGVDMTTLGIDLNAQGEPVFAKVPSWQTLDYIKRGVDNVVEQYRDKTTGKLVLDTYGRAADATRTEFRNTLKGLNPDYAKALEAYSGPSTSLDALKAGEEFLRREPEEIAARLGSLGTGDQEFYRLGAASSLRKAIAKTGAQGDEARKIVGNAYTRMQLRPLFDTQEGFDNFINSVTAESRMFGTRFNVLRGSQTGARLAEDTSPQSEAFLSAGKGAVQAAHGNWIGAGLNGLKAMTSLGRAGDPALNADIARFLTAPANDSKGAGMRLLQEFGTQMPATRNYLSQIARPLAPALAPAAQATAQGLIGP